MFERTGILEFCLQHNGKILCQIFVAFKLILCQIALSKLKFCTLDPKLCAEVPSDHKGKMSQLHARAKEFIGVMSNWLHLYSRVTYCETGRWAYTIK